MFDKNYVFSHMTRAKGCPFETRKISLTCICDLIDYGKYVSIKIEATMNIKKIVWIATAPVWLPVWPIVATAKRLYRTHNNQKELFRQWKGRKLDPLSSTSRELESGGVSFREAVAVAERNARSSGKSYSIAGIRKWFLWRKRLILAGAYPMFVLGLLTCWTDSLGWPTWCGPSLMFVSLQLALQAVPAQFRIWQIDSQRLNVVEKGGFDDFKRECRWFLDSIDPEIRFRSGHIASAVLCVFLLLPAVSHADAISEITSATTTDDLSMKGLVSMFGQIVNDPLNAAIGDGGDTLSSQIIKVFCSSLLIMATAMGGYLVLRKTAKTAHDGQYMDREQGSFWAPIRILAAFSMLTPLPNGWCLASLLMLFMAKLGIGIANMGTQATMAAFQAGQTFVLQPVAPSTDSLAHELFRANLCMFGINASLDAVNAAGGFSYAGDYINQSDLPDDNGFILKSRSYTCGGATIDVNSASALSNIDMSAIQDAHITALNEMQRALRSGAQEFVSGVLARQQNEGASLVSAEAIIQNASQIYENKVTAALRSANLNSQLKNLTAQVADSISTHGWFELGAWYQTLATANNRVSEVAAAKGNAFGASVGQQPATDDEYRLVMSAYQAQNSVRSSSGSEMLTAKSSYKANEISGADGVIDYVFHTMFQNLTAWSVGLAVDDNGIVNPLIAMKNFGDRLLTTSEVGIATFAGLQALSKAADSSLLGKVANFVGLKALTGFIDSIAWFVKIALIALLGFGITLSVYLPMLPFIIWLMACVNYLVIVGEAIFAAPLWAFSHLLSDGEGMGHKTAHGYLFLLNLAFRPILMVGGFLLGGTAVFVGGMLLNTLFETAVANGHSSSVVGVATFVGTLAVYCSLSLGLVSTSFSLTNIVPDGVISWIGGHSGAVLGRDVQDKSQSSMDRMGGKAEQITGQATGASIVKGAGLPGGKPPEGNSIK
ncbi:DotA/TraY family protein [Salmonella enterica subsp. enterica serovar Cotham]|uniref:DotA/TraY family protein n=1 Tax=Salmonella enterica TaxID=28901 RepID=A0A758BEG2_SALER|nr:DotA/TraY family protein [Salmonella enterica]EIK9383105.1 DotA/TraY family protein [Salmonella enterica subsp. enterica serovar Hadar]EIQ6703471.1 DotA/TraY family protein [Salmonella enterica subsp. enterica serovar 4,[5],12:i:-]EIT8342484.1 DotA/TraY family protein [Salmonella enterica subsp. enterica serovar Cotham]EIT8355779.1 DotA/TraY family protein [Salmonella enterica subsp. enterica serovar Cotham]